MKFVTYLINLDGSSERFDSATAQLVREGIKFERVSAVDGRGKLCTEFDVVDANSMRAFLGRDLSGGEVGCFLSHKQCVERFLETDADYAIVIEDDLKIQKNFEIFLREIVPSLPRGWHVINFGNEKNKIFSIERELVFYGESLRLASAHYFPMTTTGLCWSREGARQFLQTCSPIFSSIDRYLRYWQSRVGLGYCFIPPLVTTTGVNSDISRPKKTQGFSLLEKLVYGAKKSFAMNCDKAWAYGWKLRNMRKRVSR